MTAERTIGHRLEQVAARTAALVALATIAAGVSSADPGKAASGGSITLWQGILEVGAHGLWVAVRTDATGAVWFDSPDQGVRDIPATFATDRDSLAIEVPSMGARFLVSTEKPAGDQSLDALPDELDGTWTQGGTSLPLTLRRVDFPDYLDPGRVVERDFGLGHAEESVPATLTLPAGQDRFPVAIILSGSGPNDRDGMMGPNRVYRDLAWGLARQGIASIRFDKRTRHYGSGHAGGAADFGFVEWEYADDAAHALNAARAVPGAESVILIGHSLGATVAPRIAAEQKVDALVMIAASARRLAQVSIDQNRYLAARMEQTAELQAQMDGLTAFFEAVLRREVPADSVIPPGIPVAYYYALDDYLPQDYVGELAIPVLVTQGEKDFQSLMDSDYGALRDAFSGVAGITFTSFPTLNHLMMVSADADAGVSEYRVPGFVDDEFMASLAAWIRSLR